MRARVVLVTVVVLALAGGAWWVLRDRGSAYSRALDSLPAATRRATFTDWSAIRMTLKQTDLQDFVDEAYDADLSRTSAMENVAATLDERFGISVRELQWEVYGQSDDGAVDILRMGEDASFARLRADLRRLGYEVPKKADRAWTGNAGQVAGIDPLLGAVQQNVVLLEDQGLVLFSDDPTYAERAADVALGKKDSLLDSVDDLADEASGALSAVIWSRDQACTSLAMTSADASDQAVGERLVEEAGGVSPLSGLVMARRNDGHVVVGMQFENDDQAEENLQPRTDLASGDAPGLGGTFAERFKIDSAESHGSLVVLDLEPNTDEDSLLSVVSNGPVLFATC